MVTQPDIFAYWAGIDRAARVHPSDADILASRQHGFDLRCLPQPFTGPLRTAPVVLLYLSPGLADEDIEEAKTARGQRRFERQRGGEEPLPTKDEHLASAKWYEQRTKVFAPYDTVRHKVAILNLGPYHSKDFKDWALLDVLPSCKVALSWAESVLFPQAKSGERVVICLRSRKQWNLPDRGQIGKSLFVPEFTRSGHMVHGPLREKVVRAVRIKLED